MFSSKPNQLDINMMMEQASHNQKQKPIQNKMTISSKSNLKMQIVDDFYDVDEEVEKADADDQIQKQADLKNDKIIRNQNNMEQMAAERKERMAQRKLARQKRQLEEIREMGVISKEEYKQQLEELMDKIVDTPKIETISKNKEEFTVKHAPDIEQPKGYKIESKEEAKEVKEEVKEQKPVPADEKWIDMELEKWTEFNSKVLGSEEDKLIVVMYKAKWCRACK